MDGKKTFTTDNKTSLERFKEIISDGTMYEEEETDQSFSRLEKLCDNETFTVNREMTEREKEHLLGDIDVPNFDDTLQEVDFILSLGLKLKKAGKINFPTPRLFTTNSSSTSHIFEQNKLDMSVCMTVDAQSSPKSHLQPVRNSRRISKVISPIPSISCRTNLFNQKNFMSPTIK